MPALVLLLFFGLYSSVGQTKEAQCLEIFSVNKISLLHRSKDLFGSHFSVSLIPEIVIRSEAIALWTERAVVVKPKDQFVEYLYRPTFDPTNTLIEDMTSNGRWVLFNDPQSKRHTIVDVVRKAIVFDRIDSHSEIRPALFFLGNGRLLEIDADLNSIRIFDMERSLHQPFAQAVLFNTPSKENADNWTVHFDVVRNSLYIVTMGVNKFPLIKRYTLIGNRLREGRSFPIAVGEEYSSGNNLTHEVYQARFNVEGMVYLMSGYFFIKKGMTTYLRAYSLENGELVQENRFHDVHIEQFAVTTDGSKIAYFGREWSQNVLKVAQLNAPGQTSTLLATFQSPFPFADSSGLNDLQAIDYIEWKSLNELIFKEDHGQDIYQLDMTFR